MFELHTRLREDCIPIGKLPLCHVLLMNDSNYPWLILVPRRQDIEEIYQLEAEDQEQLTWESSFVASRLAADFKADKMNIAALGNVVPQLHIHHVVRHQTDVAWPNPIWGHKPVLPYSQSQLDELVQRLRQCFKTSTFTAAAGQLHKL